NKSVGTDVAGLLELLEQGGVGEELDVCLLVGRANAVADQSGADDAGQDEALEGVDTAGGGAELKTALDLLDEGADKVGGIDAALAEHVVEALHAFHAPAHGDGFLGDTQGEIFDFAAGVRLHVRDGGGEI